MAHWSEPINIKEWSRRILAVRPILLTLLVSCFFMLELRFDWVERALGAYLVTTNSERPESGAIWEQGRHTQNAKLTLEKIVTDRQTSQREVRSAATFSQIAAGITPGQGVMLSTDHFRQLYLKLPQTVMQEFMSPFDLLRIAGEGQWRRTYFEKRGDDLTIYLLDADNRVLRQLDIPANALAQLNREDAAAAETLEELPNFENRIYAAGRFFKTLEAFPEDVRRSMLPRPEMLLQLSGQIVRVGISDEAVSGFIELGFEILDGTRRKVILVQGQEWAVWRLRSALEEQAPPAVPALEPGEKRTPK